MTLLLDSRHTPCVPSSYRSSLHIVTSWCQYSAYLKLSSFLSSVCLMPLPIISRVCTNNSTAVVYVSTKELWLLISAYFFHSVLCFGAFLVWLSCWSYLCASLCSAASHRPWIMTPLGFWFFWPLSGVLNHDPFGLLLRLLIHDPFVPLFCSLDLDSSGLFGLLDHDLLGFFGAISWSRDLLSKLTPLVQQASTSKIKSLVLARTLSLLHIDSVSTQERLSARVTWKWYALSAWFLKQEQFPGSCEGTKCQKHSARLFRSQRFCYFQWCAVHTRF